MPMSRPALVVIAIILLLGLAGGAVIGWLYVTRDRVSLLTYRVQVSEETNMREVVAKEEKLLKSDEVLMPVIEALNLVERWGMDSEGEALAHMRTKLVVSEDRVRSGVRVIYRDRKQDRALEVLDKINEVFAVVRFEAIRSSGFPPLAPLKNQAGEGSDSVPGVPGAATP
ncbi:MAG: hypothetical protein CMP28_06120 [Roseibacillus sp.]|nr:hypothetical protein [Roseibacillus sp.]